MTTFLQTLGERDRAADRAAADYRASAEVEQLLEDAWARQDPYQVPDRAHQSLTRNLPNDLLVYGASGFHAARPGSRRDGDLPPFYRTELQHWHIVDAARVLEAFAPTAVNVLDILTQFIIFTGFDYQVVPRKMGSDKALADTANLVVEDWFRQVKWRQWERESFRRTRRDGEAFLEFEDNAESGMPDLVSVEPEQVKQPINERIRIRNDATWKYGILTTRDNTSVPFEYWVIDQYHDESNRRGGHAVKAENMIHIKTEWIDRKAKRGVSDFFCNANDIVDVRKMLRALVQTGTGQANIMYVKESPEGMVPAASSGGDPIKTRTGDLATGVHIDGPTIVKVSHGYKYHPGPIADRGRSEAIVKVFQAGIRNIGARWQFPEGMISADSSNANLASAVVAEAPMIKAMEFRQKFYVDEFKEIISRVLDWAARLGKFGGKKETILDAVRLVVKPPAVGPRHRLEETQRNQILYGDGILSAQTLSGREDLDFAEEQANTAAAGEIAIPETAESQAADSAQPGNDNERRDNP